MESAGTLHIPRESIIELTIKQKRTSAPFPLVALRSTAFRVPNSMYAGTVQPLHARVGTYAPDFALTLAGEISVYPFGLVYSFGQCGAAYELDELDHEARRLVLNRGKGSR